MGKDPQKEKELKRNYPTLTRREFSSGGVVFKKLKTRNSRFKVLWLVTKSKPSRKYPGDIWRLPKGWIDDTDQGKKPGPLASGEKRATESDLREAALREVEEEAGVRAKIVAKIGTEKFFFKTGKETVLKFVTFYLMEWVSDLPEGFGPETQKIKWLKYKEAKKRLTYAGEVRILAKAKEFLDKGVGRNLV